MPAVCLALWVCRLVEAGQRRGRMSLQRNEEAWMVKWEDFRLGNLRQGFRQQECIRSYPITCCCSPQIMGT